MVYLLNDCIIETLYVGVIATRSEVESLLLYVMLLKSIKFVRFHRERKIKDRIYLSFIRNTLPLDRSKHHNLCLL